MTLLTITYLGCGGGDKSQDGGAADGGATLGLDGGQLDTSTLDPGSMDAGAPTTDTAMPSPDAPVTQPAGPDGASPVLPDTAGPAAADAKPWSPADVAPPPADVRPVTPGAKLSATTFVFVRSVSSKAKHIIAYDIATKKETVLTNLDDSTSGLIRLDISPDRSRVAFTATFRQSAQDAVNPSEILWTITADGKTFERQTPPFPDPDTTDCTSDASCNRSADEYCNVAKRKCSKHSYMTQVMDPEWSADGKTLYMTYGTTWTTSSTTTPIGGGTQIATVPFGSGGSGFKIPSAGIACQAAAEPVVAPSGTWMMVSRSSCVSGSGDGGFVGYDLPIDTAMSGTQVLTGGNELSLSSGKAAFLDETTLVFLGSEGSDPTSVMVADLSTGQFMTWVSPQTGGAMTAVTVSPDAGYVVACQTIGGASDLFLLPTDDRPPTQLTTDGASCYPAW